MKRRETEHSPQLSPIQKKIKELYQVLGLVDKFDPDQIPKRAKANLIWNSELIGFQGTPQFNTNNPFEIRKDNLADLTALIEDLYQQGKVLHIRIIENSQKSSNSRMVYILENEHSQALIYQNGVITKMLDTDEKIIELKPGIHLDIFEQDPSDKFKMSGFTNIDGKKEVKLGGGYRIQLDDIETSYFTDKNGIEVDSLDFIFTANFVFNDMGPRGTADSDQFSHHLPKFNTKIRAKLINGQLVIPFCHHLSGTEIMAEINQAILEQNIELFSIYLLGLIFHREGRALAKLFIASLNVLPDFKTHSIEAVFATRLINNYPSVEHKHTSADGFDTLTSWVDEETKEKILANKKILEKFWQIKYLNFISPYLADIFEIDFHQITQHLPKKLRQTLKSHLFKNGKIHFTNQRTTPRLLGMLLGQSNIKWEKTENPYLFTYTDASKKNIFYYLNITGFELAFWYQNNELVQIEDVMSLTGHLPDFAQIFESTFVQAMISGLREGE